MNTGVGPAFFPVIQIGLSLVESFETEPFQRRLLSVTDSALHLAFGEKRALQIVRVTTQKFSQLHTPSIP